VARPPVAAGDGSRVDHDGSRVERNAPTCEDSGQEAAVSQPSTSKPRRGLRVRPGLLVPESEIVVRRTRSSGPGGQNVNKVATRIELEFDITQSAVLDDEQKARLRERLRSRVSRDGVLRVVSQRFRSQLRNEDDARERLAALLAAALTVRRQRRATRPTGTAKQQRLAAKRRRSRLKTRRRTPHDDD
jgi:ribosome-associated protein